MDLKQLPAIAGDLPDKAEPHKRYVVIAVTNGSAGPPRTIVRVVPSSEHSEHVVHRLKAANGGLRFELLASGRIEKCSDSDDLVMYRGTDKWDHDIEGANLLRVMLKGRRVHTSAPPLPRQPAVQASA